VVVVIFLLPLLANINIAIMGIKKFISNLLKEAGENSPYCIARVMSIIAFVSFLAYAIFALVVKDKFDVSGFANGLMQVLLGCGGIIAGKNLTQKDS
jgi:hypothetical protein